MNTNGHTDRPPTRMPIQEDPAKAIFSTILIVLGVAVGLPVT
ncbi:MAG: hypothetical protein ACOYD0_08255 [Candidatus Nanopelagicales bacterium]